jgi:ApaG protein
MQSMSSALTDGISVAVRSDFRPDRSEPGQRRWFFTYTVTIRNQGTSPAKLVSRRWLITDGAGRHEEVEGDGVVGRQPRLEPGQAFEYTSFCVLPTSHGSMRGSYRMTRDDGTPFDAVIAPFSLVVPGTLN